MQATYVTSAMRLEQLPTLNHPEIALIGRSNSGKSTLLNSMTGTRGLARTSRTPGRTQMINFFQVNNRFSIADLPGYGFSQTPRAVAKHWEKLIPEYLETREIRWFLFLMDSRRELDNLDRQILQEISAKIPPIVILTKIDKLSKAQLSNQVKLIAGSLKESQLGFHSLLPVSAKKGQGVEALQDIVFDRKS